MSKKAKFQELDQNFEQFLDNVRIEHVETEFTPEKKKQRLKKANADDLQFCRIYFPQIFCMPFNELHIKTANLQPGRYTRSGFRKCGKSAFVYTALAIKPLVQGIGGIIAINCQTDEISTERTAALIRLIERNRLLCYDYDVEFEQKLKGWYIVNRTMMIAGSVMQGMRNLVDDNYVRIRRSIQDDMYDKTNVTSEKWCRRCVDFVDYEVTGQLEDDGISVTLGNATSETAPIVTLKEQKPENHFGLPALDENGESTWPEYRTTDDWDKIRKDLPWDVWAGDYQDKPAVKGDIFDPDWLRSVNMNFVNIVASISSADPSHGTSPSACDKGLVTVGITSSNEVVVQDIYIRKENYMMFFDYVDALRIRIPHWKVLTFENDFNQWAHADPYYKDWMEQRKDTIPLVLTFAKDLVTQHRGADKDTRILNLVHPHQTGMILYDQRIINTPDYQKFRSQYLSFGKSQTKLDGLDAEATAYIMVFRYINTGSFKPIKKRKFTRIQSWFRR